MRQTTFTVLVLLFLSTALTAPAQENKTAAQKPPAKVTTDGEKPKNEVEKMMAVAKERGEEIVLGCPDGCGKNRDTAGPGILNGKAVQLPKPAYPPIARAAHAEGVVDVQVLIDYKGRVVAAAVISGHPLLQSASLQAARNSVFEPMKLDGQPVKVTGVIRYRFVAE